MKSIHITTASDLNMAPCLHATLLSALDNLAADRNCCFYLYLKDFRCKEISLLKRTLSKHEGRYELIIQDVDQIELPEGKGISGNKMCYSLFAALNQDISEHIIWIDADMIVLTDLSVVWDELVVSDKSALVVARRTLEFAHPMERTVMHQYGMQDRDPFFNSAFLGVNSCKFREMNGYRESFDFIQKHPEQGDQGAINRLFHGQLHLLDDKYNVPYWPGASQQCHDPKDVVCHFIGSPKPWDLFGELFHPSYPIFRKYLSKTAYSSRYRWRYFSVAAWRRCVRISYKYIPLMKRKLGFKNL